MTSRSVLSSTSGTTEPNPFTLPKLLQSLKMFSVVPLVPRYDNAVYGKQRHHPSVQETVDMDLDEAEDEDGAGPSRITSPGEVLSSSTAVLRYVRLCYSIGKYFPEWPTS